MGSARAILGANSLSRREAEAITTSEKPCESVMPRFGSNSVPCPTSPSSTKVAFRSRTGMGCW